MVRGSWRLYLGVWAAATLLQGQSSAQTWRPTGGGHWNRPETWGGTLPANDGTANLVFSAAGNPSDLQGSSTFHEDWDVASLTWNPVALRNNRVTLRSANDRVLTLREGLDNQSSGRVEILAPLSISGQQTWHDSSTPAGSIFSTPGTMVMQAVSGSGGIRKSGSGLLWLYSTENTYSGGTVISEGVLEASSATSLGVHPEIQIQGGTLRFNSLGDLVLPQNLVIGAAGGTLQTRALGLTITGSISGSGSLRFDADPSYSLSGTRFSLSGTNSYSGGTIIGAATVDISGTDRSLGSGPVSVHTGGVLKLAAAENLAPGHKVGLQPGSALVLKSAAIDPTQVIDPDPARTTGGILALGADRSTPLDMATIGNGKLFLGSSGTVHYTAPTLGPGVDGIYRLGGGSGANNAAVVPPTLILGSAENLLTGSRSVIIGDANYSPTEVRSSSIVVIQGRNNYDGGTALIGGTLKIEHSQSLGSGALTLRAGQLNTGTGVATLTHSIKLSGEDSSHVFIRNEAPLALSGAIDLNGGLRALTGGIPPIRLTNTISNGSLELRGGSWSLEGTNTFAGGLTVWSAVSVHFTEEANLGAPGALLTLKGGRLVANSSLALQRPIRLEGTTSIIDTDGHSLTLSELGSPGGFVKEGSGTLTLEGTNHSFTNATINAGTLQIDTGDVRFGRVSVEAGGRLIGRGSLEGTFIRAGGAIAPGGDSIGTFDFNADLNLRGGSILEFDIGLNAFDQIIIKNGMLRRNDVGLVVVSLADAGGLAIGQTFTLIDWRAGTNGSFTAAHFDVAPGLIDGDFAIVNKTLQFTVTSVPEPTSLSLLLIGGLMAATRRRQR